MLQQLLCHGNGTNPVASHVGKPLLCTAHWSRPHGAREGCVADGEAIIAEDLFGPARGSSRVVPIRPVAVSRLARILQ